VAGADWQLTLNIPSLAHQRCWPSWGPQRTPWFFCNVSTVWCGTLLKLCFLVCGNKMPTRCNRGF